MHAGSQDTGHAESELVRDLCIMDRTYFDLGCEVIFDKGVHAIRNTAAPLIYDANHINLLASETAPGLDTLETLADRIHETSPHRAFKVSPLTPPSIHAALALADYEYDEGLMMLLDGELQADASSHDIRPVESAADWAAWEALHLASWAERRDQLPVDHADLAAQAALNKRSAAPDVRYWLAYADGEPAAYCSSWPGVNGVGLVEDLFTLPARRRRRLATSLIACCVADARERGADRIAIPCNAHDTPKHMYAAMGWRPVYLYRTYIKRLPLA